MSLTDDEREKLANTLDEARRALRGSCDDRGVEDEVRNAHAAIEALIEGLADLGSLKLVPPKDVFDLGHYELEV